MSRSSVNRILARNSLTNLVRYIVNFATIFYLTPIVIRTIGDAQYGLWSLTFSLVGYAGLLDMGVQLAAIKLVAQYNAQNDIERLSGLCSTVLAFFTIVGILAMLFCWFVLPPYMWAFVDDTESLAIASKFLFIIGLDVLFVFVGNVFIGVGLGLQQYHLRGILDMLLALFKLVLSITALQAGMGLLGLAWVKLALDATTAVVMCIVCKKTVNGLSFSLKFINKKSFISVFSIACMLFFSSTMTRINQNSFPVIISIFLSTTWTAYFAAASRVCSCFKDLTYSMTASFLPMFSEMTTKKDLDGTRKVYIIYTRYILMLFLPGYIFLVLCGHSLLDVWIGPEYGRQSGDLLRLLAVAAMLEGLQPLAGRVLIGGSKVKQYAIIVSVINGLSILICLVAVPRIGIIGAALAQCVSSACGFVAISMLIHSYLELHLGKSLKMLAGVCVPSLVFASFLMFWDVNEPGQGMSTFVLGSIKAYAVTLLSCLVVLTSGERGYVFGWVKKIVITPVFGTRQTSVAIASSNETSGADGQ